MKAMLLPLLTAFSLYAGQAQAQVYDSTLGLGGRTGDLGCTFGALVGSRFPTNRYDPRTHERVLANVSACTGGYIKGVNLSTGAHWNADLFSDGQARGRDADGDHWRYDPKARMFTNLATRQSCAHTDLRYVCKSAG